MQAANCVIYLDPMNHAVSYVQGRGRARHEKSSFVMLSERADRPASVLAQQEKEQHDVASSYSPTLARCDDAADKAAQTSRERGAAAVLEQDVTENSLSALNLYCKKTKVVLEEQSSIKGPSHHYTLIYKSVLRVETAKASGDNKKQAKKRAALALLRALRTATADHARVL